MSLWSRIGNVLRGERLNREIDEELRSHVEEAIEQGRDPSEARRAFGSTLRTREASRDIRLAAWLDSLRADAVFGWRQIVKNKTASAAAVLSLGLAIGACTAAFRLIDALLLRPLPVEGAERLYVISRRGVGPGGEFRTSESAEYPLFRQMREAVKGHAELIAISYPDRIDLTYASDHEMEKANRQYVSGWMFEAFGLRPAAGRLFTGRDDSTPGGHPYAVLSHDYWTRRFSRDPKAIGGTFRTGNGVYEIVGVAGEKFTGTETGTVIDVFVPTMMHRGVTRSDWSWFRPMVLLNPGIAPEVVVDRLRAPFEAFQQERAKGFTDMSKKSRADFLNQTLTLEPAAAGFSEMQKSNRRGLIALGVLVALVLSIACANVANLMMARAMARSREIALRVSIGAGRRRLVQMVLVESAWIALLAAAVGAPIAWLAAPMVVGMINPPDDPARLFLPADPRVLGFGAALSLGVTCLLGLATALRVSTVRPATAIRGGEEPRYRRRMLHALVAVQAAFCTVVHYGAGLFTTTFDRLSHQPTGFLAERLLTLDTVAAGGQPHAVWEHVAESLRAVPGVERVAMADWALLRGTGWNGFVAIDGRPPTPTLSYFLSVSPGWPETMKIPLLDGRDFHGGDVHPGPAIVNQAFVKEYFGGESPLGKAFEKAEAGGRRVRFRIVGVAGDARYRNMREPITPTAYVPFRAADAPRERGTFLVRTLEADPMAVAPMLRGAVTQARSEFRVSSIRTQIELNRQHTVRERLLAVLAQWFAGVALVLAAVGLFGVLDYSVLRRRREIGIRVAVGAHAGDVIRSVTSEVFATVLAGALAGLLAAIASARYVATLLYEVKPTDPAMLAVPSLTILTVALLAALPPVIRAVRIDPVKMLRAD